MDTKPKIKIKIKYGLNPEEFQRLLNYYKEIKGKDSKFLEVKAREARDKLLNQRKNKFREQYGLTPDESKLVPQQFNTFQYSALGSSDLRNAMDYLNYANELAGNKQIPAGELMKFVNILDLVKDGTYTDDELGKIYDYYRQNDAYYSNPKHKDELNNWLMDVFTGREHANAYEGNEYANYAKNITDLGGIPSREQWLRDTLLKSNLPANIQRYNNFQDDPEEAVKVFKDVLESAQPSTTEQVNTPSATTETVSSTPKKDAYTIGMEAINKNKNKYVQLGWWD